jgi:hypothetical protein
LTDAELLERVKKNMGLAGNTFHNDTISGYIAEVKEFLLDAGVKQKVVNSSVSVGCISRGVNDLWNYGAGNAEFSPYFMQRAIQLTKKKEEELPEYEEADE